MVCFKLTIPVFSWRDWRKPQENSV